MEGWPRLLRDRKERAEGEDFASMREEGPLPKSQSGGSSQYFLETATMLTRSVQWGRELAGWTGKGDPEW